MLALRLEKDLDAKLGALAKLKRRNKSELVREAIKRLLEDEEDLDLAQNDQIAFATLDRLADAAGTQDGLRCRSCQGCIHGLAAVHLSAIAHRQGQYDQHIIAEFADDAVIPDAVPPEARLAAFQRFAEVAWILAALDALVQVVQNPVAHRAVELAKLSLGEVRNLNGPSQALS